MKWLLVFISLFLIQCTRPPPEQESCGFFQNSYGHRVSWQTLPIKLYVNTSVPSEFFVAINAAVDEYNRQGIQYFKIISYSLATDILDSNDGYSSINWLNTWDSNQPHEEARTRASWQGTKIFEADININAYNFNYSAGDPVDPYTVDMTSLLIHELGHVLGFTHNTTLGSVMNPQLQKGQIRRTLGQIDIQNLKCQYE